MFRSFSALANRRDFLRAAGRQSALAALIAFGLWQARKHRRLRRERGLSGRTLCQDCALASSCPSREKPPSKTAQSGCERISLWQTPAANSSQHG